MAIGSILPAVIEYQNKLLKNIQGLYDVLGEDMGREAADGQIDLLKRISIHMNKMKDACDEMLSARKKANKIEEVEAKAVAYCDEVKVYFDDIRYHADKLEGLVEDKSWPFPKFSEMLFTR